VIPKPDGDQLGQQAPGIGTVPKHPSSLRPGAPSRRPSHVGRAALALRRCRSL
jgi:hypothetical protein